MAFLRVSTKQPMTVDGFLVGDYYVSRRTDSVPQHGVSVLRKQAPSTKKKPQRTHRKSGALAFGDTQPALLGLHDIANTGMYFVEPLSPASSPQQHGGDKVDLAVPNTEEIGRLWDRMRPLFHEQSTSPAKLFNDRQMMTRLSFADADDDDDDSNSAAQQQPQLSLFDLENENINPAAAVKIEAAQQTIEVVAAPKPVVVISPHVAFLEEAKKSLSEHAHLAQALRCAVSDLRTDVEKVLASSITEMHQTYRNSFAQTVQMYNALLADVEKKYHRERALRREIHNQLQELHGNIRVFCRVRPIGSTDPIFGQHADQQILQRVDEETVSLQPTTSATKSFQFDHVFGGDASQEKVFEQAKPLITSLLDGFNVCVMAYGRTAAGKTFTLMGPHHVTAPAETPMAPTTNPTATPSPVRSANPGNGISVSTPTTSTRDSNRGMIPRTVEMLFAMMRSTMDVYAYQVSVSVLEIYNNDIVDLLLQETPVAKPKECILQIRRDGSIEVANLTEVTVRTVHETLQLIDRGFGRRAAGATELNAHSSRSHCVVTVRVMSQEGSTGVMRRSKLTFVDLAGSECIGLSQVSGEAAKEASHINKSLSALSDVLLALGEKREHIPYRNSKLTFLLRDSIGGDAKMLLLLCVSPLALHLIETNQSLQFGQRASCIQRPQATTHVHTTSSSVSRATSVQATPTSTPVPASRAISMATPTPNANGAAATTPMSKTPGTKSSTNLRRSLLSSSLNGSNNQNNNAGSNNSRPR